MLQIERDDLKCHPLWNNYKGFLDKNQRSAIIDSHHCEKNVSYADRLKAILLLNDGYGFEQTAKILLMNDQTIRNYLARHEEKSIEGLLSDRYTRYSGYLTEEEQHKLTEHLEEYTESYCLKISNLLMAIMPN